MPRIKCSRGAAVGKGLESTFLCIAAFISQLRSFRAKNMPRASVERELPKPQPETGWCSTDETPHGEVAPDVAGRRPNLRIFFRLEATV